MKTVIEVKKVSKHYRLGELIVKAVDEVDLKITKGEFVTILGPSGSGKSTLMHLMGLLDKPSKGNIYFNKRNVLKLSDRETTRIRNTEIGFVFQFFFLSPNLSAFENVELPTMFAGASLRSRRAKVKGLLNEVGLTKRQDHFPNQLSGGERQRVAIARALVNDPSIIFADEPTGNLDSKTGKEVLKLFKSVWNKGNTLVIVTHDESIAKIAPRTIKMLDGKVVSDNQN